GGYADAHLAGMDAAALDAFEALLAEDDHDLYQWVTGQAAPPARLALLIEKLAVRTDG
ncbi:succinate dehydrogenase assembly factor 2, partial [Rhodovulum sp.]|uniref:FAD assembly factor SdhE n=1 Tax=Rhodovulum sp. TaxID=34009 RepID=UPI00178E63CF